MSLSRKLPEWQEVEEYTKKTISYCISRKSRHLPNEILEDMSQHCWLEVWKAYSQRFDAQVDGWKSFVQQRVNGAILDFLKLGRGFEEIKWKQKKVRGEENQEDYSSYALHDRVTNIEKDKESGDFGTAVEAIAGSHGVSYNLKDTLSDVKWELVAKLASQDDIILLVAKHLLGETFEEMSQRSGVSRERFSQRYSEFFEKLDSVLSIDDKWTNQVIYAFGLCDVYGIKNKDYGLGHDLDPLDLFSDEIYFEGKKYSPQTSLFEHCESPEVKPSRHIHISLIKPESQDEDAIVDNTQINMF